MIDVLIIKNGPAVREKWHNDAVPFLTLPSAVYDKYKYRYGTLLVAKIAILYCGSSTVVEYYCTTTTQITNETVHLLAYTSVLPYFYYDDGTAYWRQWTLLGILLAYPVFIVPVQDISIKTLVQYI
jgi:hypothetical protein